MNSPLLQTVSMSEPVKGDVTSQEQVLLLVKERNSIQQELYRLTEYLKQLQTRIYNTCEHDFVREFTCDGAHNRVYICKICNYCR